MAAGSPWSIPWLMLSAALSILASAHATKSVAEYDFSDPDICSAEKYVIDLFHGPKSQTVLYFDGSNLAEPLKTRGIFKCNAEIRAPPGHGLGIVVYEMNLRRRGPGCVDSIAFVEDALLVPDKLRDAFWRGSGKICGNLTDAVKLKVEPMNADEQSGLLGFHYVVWQRMDVKFRLDASIPMEYKETVFRAVVTAYLKSPCEPQYFSCGGDVCVSKVLVCNGIPNCGFNGGIPGGDEVNCTDGRGYVPGKIRLSDDKRSKDQTSKLAVWIGVFAGAIISFGFVSLFCVWRARRRTPGLSSILGPTTTISRPDEERRLGQSFVFSSRQGGTNTWGASEGRPVTVSAHDFPPNLCVRYNTTTERIDVYETEEEAELAAKNDLPPPSYNSLFDERNAHGENVPGDLHVEPPSYYVVAGAATDQTVTNNGGNTAP